MQDALVCTPLTDGPARAAMNAKDWKTSDVTCGFPVDPGIGQRSTVRNASGFGKQDHSDIAASVRQRTGLRAFCSER